MVAPMAMRLGKVSYQIVEAWSFRLQFHERAAPRPAGSRELCMRWIERQEMDQIGDWRALVEALRNGHLKAKPQLNDWLVRDGNNAWLTRSAWMPGGDLGLKSVTVFPGNKDLDPPVASINGAFLLYNAQTGVLDAVLDGKGITD